MVFVTRNDYGGLGQGILNIGNVLGEALDQRAERNQQKQSGSILSRVFGELGEDATPERFNSALAQAMAEGVPMQTAVQYGNLLSSLRKSEPKGPFANKSPSELADVFEKFGMDRDTAERNAELYSSLTTGGQTRFGEMIIDQIQRGSVSGARGSIGLKRKENIEPNSPDSDIEASEEIEWEWPDVNPFEGMTPREAINFRGKLFKENNAHFADISDKLKNSNRELRDINQLKKLNDSGKLPKGFKKFINVDWKKGELRVPAFANKETQQYIKTVNGFIRNAKDFFGSRVTNFDLQTFLQLLPTLANSEEGRRQILDQMEAATKLNQLDNDSLKEVYEHYGLDKIDRLQLETLARDLRKPKEALLEQKFTDAIRGQEIYEFKSNASPNQIPMISEEGELWYIDKDKENEAKSQGFRRA